MTMVCSTCGGEYATADVMAGNAHLRRCCIRHFGLIEPVQKREEQEEEDVSQVEERAAPESERGAESESGDSDAAADEDQPVSHAE